MMASTGLPTPNTPNYSTSSSSNLPACSDDSESPPMRQNLAEGAVTSQTMKELPAPLEPSPAVTSGSSSASPLALNEAEEIPSASIMNSRAYQLEMLDQSLKRNVIVAMDTGSGKTQVAVLRIGKELEETSSEKLIWFLAPTVSLCAQQFDVIRLQNPAASMRLLTGNDNVKSWDHAIWRHILDKVRIVVSTYQVLLDALDHAFLSMKQFALLVFDEVHNCVGKNPGAKIMLEHYHTNLLEGVPAILGLTATPSMRSDVEDLKTLEAIMDARCISPTMHRDELIKFVKKPQISYIAYQGPALSLPITDLMKSLLGVYRGLDIRKDPRVIELAARQTDRDLRELVHVIQKYDTYSQNQMKGICSRSRTILQQLGPWAADHYIKKVVATALGKIEEEAAFALESAKEAEKRYLIEALRQVPIDSVSEVSEWTESLSSKAMKVIEVLLGVEEPVVGIVFVQDRVVVGMLTDVLKSHPDIKKRYRIGTMVGASNVMGKRRAIFELHAGGDAMALQEFRSGKINLLIATSVLEEGIDVPACNLVLCFDSPATPKSFIQRRGRARMKDSQLILLIEHSSTMLKQWTALESEMKKIYEDSQRETTRLGLAEDVEETAIPPFVIESTGARLTFDNAKAHLEHFCRTLWHGEYGDCRPDYIIRRNGDDYKSTLSAIVLLPSFVPAHIRQAESQSEWLSEKNATKDAAFQAYVALYKAELVNEHLLPIKFDEGDGLETRVPEVMVDPLMNPWPEVAKAWEDSTEKWLYTLQSFDGNGELLGEYDIILPVWLHQPKPIRVYPDRNEEGVLKWSEGKMITNQQLESLPDHTSTLVALHFAHRWQAEERRHVVRILSKSDHLSLDQLGAKEFDPNNEEVKMGQFFIRDGSQTPYFYQETLPGKPSTDLVRKIFYEYEKAPEDVPYIVLSKWTRRTDFLHVLLGEAGPAATKPYPHVVPLPWAKVDTIHAQHARFGMLIPSIIHEIEVMLIVQKLAVTLLKPLGIANLDLIRAAITSRSASEPVNYERLEFLGDSILKFITTMQASAHNLHWPEGYLTAFRDRMISNSRLFVACIQKDLPKFIHTKPFTGHKWRPLYIDELTDSEEAKGQPRKLSTKTLADVIEALIGASYQEGGLDMALKCMSLFIEEYHWRSITANRQILYDAAPGDKALPLTLKPLEELIGYQFRKKALLVEAMTHGSYVADTGHKSFERLEFLGDAVLDNIIVTRLFNTDPPLAHHQMHTLKTCMVNGDFLAFITMERGVKLTETVVRDAEIVQEDKYLYLWSFMRHGVTAIGIEQSLTSAKHKVLRKEILEAMETGTHYPWALLAHLDAKKFYSDLFEAVLGAVYVDSGSIEECEAVVARFGILRFLDRVLRDKVEMVHPKEVIGQLAITKSVTYQIDLHEGSGGQRVYRCKILVGDELIVEVDGGINREEVKTKAATAAVQILTARQKSDVTMGDE